AVVAEAIEGNYFGSHSPHIADLRFRRIRRHGNDSPNAEQRRGGGNALGMIARREGNDPSLPFLVRKRGNLVVGSAELERPGALQAFSLEENPAAEALVEHRRLQQRRLIDVAGKALRSSTDFGDSGKRGSHGSTIPMAQG